MASAEPTRRQLLAGLGALALSPYAAAEDGFTVSNARILVGDGTETTGGIRVRGGKIDAVGPAVTGGEDLRGAVIYPGIYLGATPLGLFEVDLEAASHDDAETSNAVVPQVRVVDAYNPRSEVIPVCRVGGILGALVTPTRGLVAGQAAWMRTFGDSVAETTILSPAGVCFGLGHSATGATGGPTSRMGVAGQLRDLFDANAAPAAPDPKKKKGEDKPPTYTATQRTFHALLRRETKALFFAERASDLRVALALIAEYKLDGILVGAAEGHLLAGEIAAAGVPVILAPTTTQPASFDTFAASYENPARLHAAGVKFAFRSPGAHNARDLTTEAGIAVAYGLPYGAAIAALSGNGPSFWNLDMGVLRVGAEASFVATDGDPMQPRSQVIRLWGRGAPIPVRSRQTELYERFKTLP
jgi:imidazolonepropionase-like amidohydrolase